MYLDKQRIERLTKDRFFRIEQNSKIVYQYRTLGGFWSIVESDSFWATNARFSNDDEEQKLGIQLGERALNIGESDQGQLLEDCYIVCFCGADDKLSQWRGYAKDGISIGFDFSNIRPFYINKDNRDLEIFNTCGKITYVDTKVGELEFKEMFKLGHENDVVEDESTSSDWKAKELDANQKMLSEVIPFIKHKGFLEEDEYRLVFSHPEIGKYMKYRDINGKKVPYVVVKCGKEEKRETAYLRIVIGDNEYVNQQILHSIGEAQKKCSEITIETIECNKNLEPKEVIEHEGCVGCSKRKLGIPMEDWKDKKWHKCSYMKDFSFYEEDAIYISDCKEQEKVYECIYGVLHENMGKNAPKVWCEGHLPIRSIRVGPSAKKEELKESIEHYCRHTYWLRDVDVKVSEIPYRSE